MYKVYNIYRFDPISRKLSDYLSFLEIFVAFHKPTIRQSVI